MDNTGTTGTTGNVFLLPGRLWAAGEAELRLLYAERFRGVRDNKSWSMHEFWEFTVTMAGQGKLELEDGMAFPLEPDGVLLLPPGMRHRESGNAGLETIWIGFRAAGTAWLTAACRNWLSPELARLGTRLWKLAALRRAHSGMELDGVLLQLAGMAFRLEHEAEAGEGSFGAVVAYLNEHYAETIEIGRLAERFGYSESVFFRRFKALTGQTPVYFLTELRIRQVMLHLEHSNLPLRAIAPLCGFRDPYYLSRAFRKMTGRSPQAYRAACRRGGIEISESGK